MPKYEKLIQRMKQQPNGIKFEEVAKVLENNGYMMKKSKRNLK